MVFQLLWLILIAVHKSKDFHQSPCKQDLYTNVLKLVLVSDYSFNIKSGHCQQCQTSGWDKILHRCCKEFHHPVDNQKRDSCILTTTPIIFSMVKHVASWFSIVAWAMPCWDIWRMDLCKLLLLKGSPAKWKLPSLGHCNVALRGKISGDMGTSGSLYFHPKGTVLWCWVTYSHRNC